jgi:hypothetical protein
MNVNSLSLYRCPDQSIFDETSQECLMKVPINDNFDQLAPSSPTDDSLFQKVASFIVPDSISDDDQQKNNIEPFLIKKLFNEVRYSSN